MTQKELNSEWRKVASALYSKPVDAKILGSVEIDVTNLERYISEKRKEGVKITLTHFFTLALARGIKEEVPELNTYIRRGKIIERDSIDAMISVLIKGEEMSSIKVPSADTLTLAELVDFMTEKIRETRSGKESNTMKNKGMLARIPWPFRRMVYKLIKFVTINLGLTVAGLSANNYGSFVVANIGTLGLDVGYPALFPTSNVAMVVTMGGVFKKPVVVNDRIVARRVMNISVALDHRIVDASHGGKLFRYTRRVMKAPEIFERTAK